MSISVADDQWNDVRSSLRQTGERFAALVSSAPDPAAEATVGWSVADIAAHVTAIAWVDTTLLQPSADPFPMPRLAERMAGVTVDGVHALNDLVLSHFTERDPKLIVSMLRDHIDRILDACEGHDPSETVPWLGGSQLPLAGLIAHLVNELLIHGNDIARFIRAPWAMPPRDAAHFFDLVLVGLARGEMGQLIDGGGPPQERRIAVEFRSGYTTPITLVLRRGRLSAESPGRGADARVTFDPVALNLLLFGRISKARAVMTRKLVITGRRPWLVLAFLRTVRAPS